jgi:glycyl-tRNA synthetase alpha subunit
VTERTAYILRVRQLAVRLCREYAAEAEATAGSTEATA